MRWLPNAITALRMALTVPLAWLILEEQHAWALLVGVVAGFSDGVDGFLAKRYGWQSQLGGLLDPVADKLMLTAGFVCLAVIGAMPWWMVALVLARDVIIVAGAVAYHNLVGPLQAAPSTISKLTTLAQILLVLSVLVDDLPEVALAPWYLTGMLWLTAAATVLSGVHYVVVWSVRARAALRRPPTQGE
jgi:cardiolipin synthase